MDLSQLAEEDSTGADSSVDPWELSPSPDSQTLFSSLHLPTHTDHSTISVESSHPGDSALVLPADTIRDPDSNETKIILTVISPEVPPCTTSDCSVLVDVLPGDALRPEMVAPSNTEQELSIRVPLSPASDCILITDSPSKVEKHFETRVNFSPSFARFPSLNLDSSSARLPVHLTSPTISNGQPPPLEPVFIPSPQAVNNSSNRAPETWLPPDNGVSSSHTQEDRSNLRAEAPADAGFPQPHASAEVNGIGAASRLPVEQDPELMKSFCSVGWLKRRNEGEGQTMVMTMADIYPNTAIGNV